MSESTQPFSPFPTGRNLSSTSFLQAVSGTPSRISSPVRPSTPTIISSSALTEMQNLLCKLLEQSPLNQTSIAPIVENLSLADPSRTEAILLALAINTTHMLSSIDARLAKMESNTSIPTAQAQQHQPQQLNQIQAVISNLADKVAIQAKRPADTSAPQATPLAKKGKKLTFAEAAKSAPPKDNASAPPPSKNNFKTKDPKDPKEKAPRPLPTAERRFFASRTTASPFAESAVLSASLPVAIGRALRAAQFPNSHSVALSVTVNDRGTVTFTANPFTPASTFVPYFSAIHKTLNESCPIGDNPFNPIRTAPTDVNVAIHNIPTFALPNEPKELTSTLSEAILYAADIQITGARYLKTDIALRATKKTTSVVISCSASDAKKIGSSIKLFSRPRKTNIMWSASSTTQCKKCWGFGHATAGCKASNYTCPICSNDHPRHEHRCSIPTCPGGGADKPTVNCCSISPPVCINCNGNHTATDLQCPSRKAILEKSSKNSAAPAADTSMSSK